MTDIQPDSNLFIESGASFFYYFVKSFAPYAELDFEILKGFNFINHQ